MKQYILPTSASGRITHCRCVATDERRGFRLSRYVRQYRDYVLRDILMRRHRGMLRFVAESRRRRLTSRISLAKVRDEAPILSGEKDYPQWDHGWITMGAITSWYTINTVANNRGLTTGASRRDVSGVLVLRRRERCAPLYLYTYKRRRAETRILRVSLFLCFSPSLGRNRTIFLHMRGAFFYILSLWETSGDSDLPKSEGWTKK